MSGDHTYHVVNQQDLRNSRLDVFRPAYDHRQSSLRINTRERIHQTLNRGKPKAGDLQYYIGDRRVVHSNTHNKAIK